MYQNMMTSISIIRLVTFDPTTVVQLAPKFVSPTPDQDVNTVKLDSV